MHITPSHITRTTAPHSAEEIFAHLRVIAPPSGEHPEANIIQRMYGAALQRIESRTRRFLGAMELVYKFRGWDDSLCTSWFIMDPEDIQLTYVDYDAQTQVYADIEFRDQEFILGDIPTDMDEGRLLTLTFTSKPYDREDLNNTILLLTAQWYENRGDQNIRGIPHWVESICAAHAWQTF